jgi:peptide subunit release factor 1 (eRF1)
LGWGEAESLEDPTELEARPFISRAELRELTARVYSQPVVSVYLNITPDVLIRDPPVYLTVFNSMRHRELAARRDLVRALSTRQRQRLEDDLDEVERLIRGLDPAGVRSLVVFKSGRELNRLIKLPVRTATSLTIDVDAYIEPLEAALQGRPRALVVSVSKEEARFWSEHLGHLEEIETLESFVPTDSVDAGRPGKVQRHRLTHLRWHLKATAHLANRLFTEKAFDLVILSGDENVLAELERFLPDQLRSRVAARLRTSARQDPGEWRRQIEEVLVEQRRQEEAAALARLGDYQGSDLLVSGLAGVIEVANRFLVRELFVSADLTQPGYVCREHHFLSLEEAPCPFCQTELVATENLVDELIEFAGLHGVDVKVIELRPELLEPYAGVAAVTYELLAA